MAERQPIRILVVDDSEDDAYLLCADLKRAGMPAQYDRVDSGPTMAAALARQAYQVVICDHDMPGFDSGGAFNVLKQSGKDIPFILYSGHISDQLALKAMQNGVQDYIQKGNVARLLPVLERELVSAEHRQAMRRADDQLQVLVNYDSLCQLPNQNLFCSRVADVLSDQSCRGKEAQGALFYINLDRFLRINSSFGYQAGNQILRQVAQRISECVDGEGVVARLGGDNFGIFLPECRQISAVTTFAEWLLEAFDTPFYKDRLELYITPSIGVALAPVDGSEVYELLLNAETAVASVKRAGGRGWRRYQKEMNANSAERIALEVELRHAIARNELFLHYQPCVDAETGRMMGVEALVRWRHSRLGMIPPDRFIPLADESGLINEIGVWVLRQACRQGRRWSEAGHRDVFMAVNVSAVQFGQPMLLEVVSQILEETGFRPQGLHLEITESVLMKDAESTIGMLRALKSMGVRIAVDDFGTGYSSLSYLKRFPIDILKIDKSFVRDLTSNEDDKAIVRAIVAIARTLRLSTVAEGVETSGQADFLRHEQCECFQGYLFSRPVDAESITKRLQDECLQSSRLMRVA